MIGNAPLFFSAQVEGCETVCAEKRRDFKMKLWIIGNGFDLYHGLKTRYADYKAFLCHRYACCQTKKWQEAQHELGWMVCRGCGKRSTRCPVCKFNKLPRVERKGYLWRDLEEACAIDLKKLMDEIKWSRTSESGKESAEVILSHSSLDFAGPFTGSEFYEWLCKVEETLSSIKSILRLGEEDWFLTFNYTDTLQEVYCIPDEHVFHVHGRLKEVRDKLDAKDVMEKTKSLVTNDVVHADLLFGSPEITDAAIDAAIDYYRTLRETSPGEMMELRKHLKRLADNLKKDIHERKSSVERWVLARCEGLSSFEEVVVAGHSLGRYDRPYFDLFADSFRSVKWRFMFYSEDDRRRAEEFCEQHRLHGYYVPWNTAGFEHVQCPADWGYPNSRFCTCTE